MRRPSALSPLALLAALVLGSATQAGADCTIPDVTSVKGTISGTFYDPAGVPTKVKCDLTIQRHYSMRFTWGGSCPGLATFGTAVVLRGFEYRNQQRIVKNGTPVKSCITSDQYTLDNPSQYMSVTIASVVTTLDVAEPTVALKEKGTMVFARRDGIFSGTFTATYPKP